MIPRLLQVRLEPLGDFGSERVDLLVFFGLRDATERTGRDGPVLADQKPSRNFVTTGISEIFSAT